MQIRAQISDKSATQIDDQITDLSNCAFQVIPKEQKKQHVVDQMLDAKVNLKLWVKVRKDWRDSDFMIKNFGYDKKEI